MEFRGAMLTSTIDLQRISTYVQNVLGATEGQDFADGAARQPRSMNKRSDGRSATVQLGILSQVRT